MEWELKIKDLDASFGSVGSPVGWVEGTHFAHIIVDNVGDLLEALAHVPLETALVSTTSESKISLVLFKTPCCGELEIEVTSYEGAKHARPHPPELHTERDPKLGNSD